jgi:hypothetical protein
VDRDEAAARADVLAQVDLRRVEVRAGRGVDRSVGSTAVLVPDARPIARPCAKRASRLLLAKITALYWLRFDSCVTSSVQSAAIPSAASQAISAFCTTWLLPSGGLRPPASRLPMLAWRGPAVRV